MSDTKPYCFSKPHITARATATATSGSSTALPPWSNRYIYAHTELDEHHTIIASWYQLCEYSCCRDPVSCLLPDLSHRPVLRNIFVVKILLYSVSASFSIALLKVPSRRQSSGGMVVRLFYLPYMIKTALFSSKVEQKSITILDNSSSANRKSVTVLDNSSSANKKSVTILESSSSANYRELCEGPRQKSRTICGNNL